MMSYASSSSTSSSQLMMMLIHGGHGLRINYISSSLNNVYKFSMQGALVHCSNRRMLSSSCIEESNYHQHQLCHEQQQQQQLQKEKQQERKQQLNVLYPSNRIWRQNEFQRRQQKTFTRQQRRRVELGRYQAMVAGLVHQEELRNEFIDNSDECNMFEQQQPQQKLSKAEIVFLDPASTNIRSEWDQSEAFVQLKDAVVQGMGYIDQSPEGHLMNKLRLILKESGYDRKLPVILPEHWQRKLREDSNWANLLDETSFDIASECNRIANNEPNMNMEKRRVTDAGLSTWPFHDIKVLLTCTLASCDASSSSSPLLLSTCTTDFVSATPKTLLGAERAVFGTRSALIGALANRLYYHIICQIDHNYFKYGHYQPEELVSLSRVLYQVVPRQQPRCIEDTHQVHPLRRLLYALSDRSVEIARGMPIDLWPLFFGSTMPYASPDVRRDIVQLITFEASRNLTLSDLVFTLQIVSASGQSDIFRLIYRWFDELHYRANMAEDHRTRCLIVDALCELLYQGIGSSTSNRKLFKCVGNWIDNGLLDSKVLTKLGAAMSTSRSIRSDLWALSAMDAAKNLKNDLMALSDAAMTVGSVINLLRTKRIVPRALTVENAASFLHDVRACVDSDLSTVPTEPLVKLFWAYTAAMEPLDGLVDVVISHFEGDIKAISSLSNGSLSLLLFSFMHSKCILGNTISNQLAYEVSRRHADLPLSELRQCVLALNALKANPIYLDNIADYLAYNIQELTCISGPHSARMLSLLLYDLQKNRPIAGAKVAAAAIDAVGHRQDYCAFSNVIAAAMRSAQAGSHGHAIAYSKLMDRASKYGNELIAALSGVPKEDRKAAHRSSPFYEYAPFVIASTADIPLAARHSVFENYYPLVFHEARSSCSFDNAPRLIMSLYGYCRAGYAPRNLLDALGNRDLRNIPITAYSRLAFIIGSVRPTWGGKVMDMLLRSTHMSQDMPLDQLALLSWGAISSGVDSNISAGIAQRLLNEFTAIDATDNVDNLRPLDAALSLQVVASISGGIDALTSSVKLKLQNALLYYEQHRKDRVKHTSRISKSLRRLGIQHTVEERSHHGYLLDIVVDTVKSDVDCNMEVGTNKAFLCIDHTRSPISKDLQLPLLLGFTHLKYIQLRQDGWQPYLINAKKWMSAIQSDNIDAMDKLLSNLLQK